MHGESNLENIIESADENFKCTYVFRYFGFIYEYVKYRFEDFSNVVKKFEVLDPKKVSIENIDENIVNIKQLSTFYEIDVDGTDLEIEYR